jgi:hypothetical protein
LAGYNPVKLLKISSLTNGKGEGGYPY